MSAFIVEESESGDYRIDWTPDEKYMVWCYWANKYVGADIEFKSEARRFISVVEREE